MKLCINGKARNLDQPVSLSEFVNHNIKHTEHLVAEVNGQIIKRHNWQKTTLNNGDTLELVTPFGGG